MATFEIETEAGTFEIESDSTVQEMEAYFSTPEGQAALQQQIDALPQGGAQEPATQAIAGSDGRENVRAIAENAGLPEFLVDNPATRTVAGLGQALNKIKVGLQQMGSTPAEALAIAKQFEKENEVWAKMDDEGFGFEDLGQAIPTLATMVGGPGAAGLLKGIPMVGKGFKFLQNLGRTLGGQAALAAVVEGSKGITPGESRAVNALSAGVAGGVGSAVVGGLGRSATAGRIGALIAASGFGQMLGSAGKQALGTRMMRSVWEGLGLARPPRDPGEEIGQRVLAGAAGPESRRIIAKATEAELELARKSGGLLPGQGASGERWSAFLDIVKGPASASTGNRSVAGSLQMGKPTKAMQEWAEMDPAAITAERGRMVAMLFEAAKKPDPSDPSKIIFDANTLIDTWNSLKNTEQFKKVYMGKSGKLNSKAKAMDDFIEDILKGDTVDAESIALNIDAVRDKGLGLLDTRALAGSRSVKEYTDRKIDRGLKLTPAETSARARALGFEQWHSQGGLEQAFEAARNGDLWALVDMFNSLEEQVADDVILQEQGK